MRSRTGSISQARAAVLPAATPINKKASMIRLAWGRMKSRDKRATSAAERAPLPGIAGCFRMSFPPAVLEAGTRLGKSGGDIKPLPRVPDPPGAKGRVG
jgi:hypothetical protein